MMMMQKFSLLHSRKPGDGEKSQFVGVVHDPYARGAALSSFWSRDGLPGTEQYAVVELNLFSTPIRQHPAVEKKLVVLLETILSQRELEASITIFSLFLL